jgi:phosphohistidine phosphatase SixA
MHGAAKAGYRMKHGEATYEANREMSEERERTSLRQAGAKEARVAALGRG